MVEISIHYITYLTFWFLFCYFIFLHRLFCHGVCISSLFFLACPHSFSSIANRSPYALHVYIIIIKLLFIMGFLVLEKLKLTFDSFSFVHHFLTKKIFFHYRFVGYQFIDFHYDLKERERKKRTKIVLLFRHICFRRWFRCCY